MIQGVKQPLPFQQELPDVGKLRVDDGGERGVNVREGGRADLKRRVILLLDLGEFAKEMLTKVTKSGHCTCAVIMD